jgi:hypothetical protein
MSLEIIIAIVGGVALPVILTWNRQIQSKMTSQEKDFNNFRVKVAETYIDKKEVHSLEDKILTRFNSLEAKIDNLIKINGRS